MDFIEIVNRIFVKKNLYNEVRDQDKIDAFFIINRKLGKGFPDFANNFNHKSIDKASAIDLWFEFFKDTYSIPKWYWDAKDRKKSSTNKTTEKEKNYDLVRQRYDLDNFDIEYLKVYFKDDLEKEMKNSQKFDM